MKNLVSFPKLPTIQSQKTIDIQRPSWASQFVPAQNCLYTHKRQNHEVVLGQISVLTKLKESYFLCITEQRLISEYCRLC